MAANSNKEDAHFSYSAVQMALKAAIELKIFDILARSGPPGTQLSAPQIASKLPNPNPNQAVKVKPGALYRILRFLSSQSFLTTTLPRDSTSEEHDRLFGLTALTARTMVRGDGAVLPLAASFLLFHTQNEMLSIFDKLKFSVLGPEGSPCPFEMTYGTGLYDYIGQRPDSEFSMLFDQLMVSSTKYFLDSVIRVYNGFHELTELLDVGGSRGSALERIISVYPNIQACVNFDLPHVISRAPPINGVKHVAGDMFQALPESKTIMLKWILHNWSDEECVKLLENCRRALPEEGGKVIVLELVIPAEPERSAGTMAVTLDIHMMVFFGGGRERTVSELRNLAAIAGFSDVNVVPIENEIHVLEFLK